MIKYLCVTVAFFFVSCSSNTQNWEERIKKTTKDFKTIQEERQVNAMVYRLSDCMAIAKEFNLDLRIAEFEKSLANGRHEAKILEFIPSLKVSADSTFRDNKLGSSSEGVSDGEESLRASTSSDRESQTFKITSEFSALDMALLLKDESLETDKERLKQTRLIEITRLLEQQIIDAYMPVAAAQHVIEHTKDQLINNAKVLLEIEDLFKKKQMNEFDVLEFKRKFLDTRKQLREYERNYANLCLELTSLMGLNPSRKITVDTTFYEVDEFQRYEFPFVIPDLEQLENAGLKNRAEIYQGEINQHIAELNSDKEFLKIFPNFKLIGGYNNSTNSFLVNNDWFSATISMTLDLFRIPTKIQNYKNSKLEIQIEKYKSIITMFSILRQIRIAYENLDEVKARLAEREEDYALSLRLQKLTEAAVQTGKMSRLSVHATVIDSKISYSQRAATLSNCFTASYRLLNAAGIPYVCPARLSKIKRNRVDILSEKEKREKTAFFDALINSEEGKIALP
jgi:outer membrane protein TolC